MLATGNSLHPIKVKQDNDIRFISYEAERAFKNVKGDVSSCGIKTYHSFITHFKNDKLTLILLTAGLRDGYSLLSDESYTIFSVQAPSDGLYPVTLNAYSCGNQRVFTILIY